MKRRFCRKNRAALLRIIDAFQHVAHTGTVVSYIFDPFGSGKIFRRGRCNFSIRVDLRPELQTLGRLKRKVFPCGVTCVCGINKGVFSRITARTRHQDDRIAPPPRFFTAEPHPDVIVADSLNLVPVLSVRTELTFHPGGKKSAHLRRREIIRSQSGRIAQTGDPVPDREVFYLENVDLPSFRVESHQFPRKPAPAFVRPEPGRQFLRVHLRHRDGNFRERTLLVVNVFCYGTDRNVFVVANQFVGGRFVEVIVHRPLPRNDILKRRNRIRFRSGNGGKEPDFQTRFHAPHQRRRCRALGICIVADSSKRFVCVHIKNDILH